MDETPAEPRDRISDTDEDRRAINNMQLRMMEAEEQLIMKRTSFWAECAELVAQLATAVKDEMARKAKR